MPCIDIHIGAATRALLCDAKSPQVQNSEPQGARRRYLECGINVCEGVLQHMTKLVHSS